MYTLTRRIIAVALALAAAGWANGSAIAQVRGISYTLTPVVEGVFYSDDAALKNAALYGGRIGFGFGEFVELNGSYLYGNQLETDFGDFGGVDPATKMLLAGLPGRDGEFQRYGGDIKFNIGRGAVFPFVTLGSGVLRFEPDGLNASESIYLSGGIGVQFSVKDRYTIIAQGGSISYRYNPVSTLLSADDLTTLGLDADDFELIDINSFSASVGVQFYLGGRAGGELTDLDRALQEQLRAGIRGVALRLEPTAGEVKFADAFGLRKYQRFLGASGGIDLGPFVGLRAFYWRGVTPDSWTDFEDIQAYGGQIKFAFSETGGSITPYLLAGGGYLDVMSDYVGNGLVEPDDHPFAFGGAGIVMPLGDAVSLDLSVRSVLMSSEGVDNVSDPGQVESNTMFAGSIAFGFGGGPASGGVFGREMAANRTDRESLASGIRTQEQALAQATTRLDSLETAVATQQQAFEAAKRAPAPVAETPPAVTPAPVASPAADTAVAAAAAPATPVTPAATEKPKQEREASDRWVSLPVPQEGELYVRYGAPGGVTVESVGGEPLTYYIDPATGALVPVGAPAATPPATSPTATGAAPAPATTVVPTAPVTAVPTMGTSLTAQQIRDIVGEVMSQERATAQTGTLSTPQQDAALDRLEKTLDQRLGTMESRMEMLSSEVAQGQRTKRVAPVVADEPRVIVQQPAAASETVVVPAGARPKNRFTELQPVFGYNIDKPKQGLIGLRGQFERSGRPYRLLAELILGFGDDQTTYNVNLNGTYDLGVGLAERVFPYLGLGIGFLDRDDLELVLNLMVGSDIRTTAYGTFFVEYMNQDFDNNRLLGGYRVRF